MMQALYRSLVVVVILISLSSLSVAAIQIPPPTGMVNDFAGKLSPATKQSLESLLINFRDRSNIEGAVVTIPFNDLQGYPLEDYSLQMGRQWGIGRDSKTPAFLLLVVIKDPNSEGVYSGNTRFETSRHLEGDVPDGLAGELIRRMRNDFRAGQFDQALATGTQTILATIAQRRGISMEGVDSRYAVRSERRPRSSGRGISPSLIILGIFVVLIIISAIGRGGRGGPGGRRRRGLGSDWLLLPIIFGGGGSGGFGGYGGNRGGSSWGDSGGGGFGGFGGGGDFGGGGASDSW